MEIFPIGMSRLDECVVSVHAEGDIPHVAIEDLLRDAQPLRCIYCSIIPFGKGCIVECCVLRVWSGLPWLEHLLHVLLI